MSVSTRPATLVFGIAAMLAGCVFVQSTVEGERVRTLTPQEVDRCTHVGAFTSSVPDHIGAIARDVDSIRHDVEQHARNEAATMGGDTIVPADALVGGRQQFQVYRCINP